MLVYLEAPVEAVAPAAVADAGYLDALYLRRETLTVVGYGINDFVKGSVVSAQPVFLSDGLRRYRDVSAVTTRGIHPDRFLKVSEASCGGDSGGPVFHGGILVAGSVGDGLPATVRF